MFKTSISVYSISSKCVQYVLIFRGAAFLMRKDILDLFMLKYLFQFSFIIETDISQGKNGKLGVFLQVYQIFGQNYQKSQKNSWGCMYYMVYIHGIAYLYQTCVFNYFHIIINVIYMQSLIWTMVIFFTSIFVLLRIPLCHYLCIQHSSTSNVADVNT